MTPSPPNLTGQVTQKTDEYLRSLHQYVLGLQAQITKLATPAPSTPSAQTPTVSASTLAPTSTTQANTPATTSAPVNTSSAPVASSSSSTSSSSSSNSVTNVSSTSGLTIRQIQASLQQNGPDPLNVTGLIGVLATPQRAGVPAYTTIPPLVDPNSQDGALASVNGILYRFSQTPSPGAWSPQAAEAAVIFDTHANRLANYSPANYALGILFFETDRLVVYIVQSVSSVKKWKYLGGVMQSTQSGLPADLGTTDINFLVNVTDYGHVLQWTGTGWQWGPGDNGSAYIQGFLDDPTGNGWHLCDGSANVNYLKSTGALGTQTLPNLASSPAFLQYGATASPTINAAVAPTFTGTPFTPSGTLSAPTLTMNSYTPTGSISMNFFTPVGTVSAPIFTGSSTNTSDDNAGGGNAPGTGSEIVSLHPHQHAFIPLGTNSAPTFTGSGATPTGFFSGTPATPTGSVSAPTFTGSSSTPAGTISNTGKPANIVLRAWFRQ